jgi:predicted lipid-binding transport protein (Tim44 family)
MFAVVLTLGMTMGIDDAEAARRLGGGKSTGMQRQTTTAPPSTPGNATNAPGQGAPATAGAAAAAAPAAAAAAGKRSWMGPLAGLAAGIGLMALASHLGFGEAVANMMMIGLLVMAVLFVVALVMRKRAASQAGGLAGAGGVGRMGDVLQQQRSQDVAFRTAEPAAARTGGSMIGSRLMGGAPAAAGDTRVGHIPADFDTAAFARNAQDQFLALQAANDARDLARLRDYLTPEMFDAVSAEIAERGDAPQRTEVFGLQAQVLDVAEEADRYVVSVRFTGSVRDEQGAVPEDLDEVWHLTKPRTGFGGWLIAGIQQAG